LTKIEREIIILNNVLTGFIGIMYFKELRKYYKNLTGLANFRTRKSFSPESPRPPVELGQG
jgi:hypothetical protein